MDNVPIVWSIALGPARYQLDKAQREMVLWRSDPDEYHNAGFTALAAVDKAVEELQGLRRALALELKSDQT